MLRFGMDAAIDCAIQGSNVTIGGLSPGRFVAGLSEAIGVPDEKVICALPLTLPMTTHEHQGSCKRDEGGTAEAEEGAGFRRARLVETPPVRHLYPSASLRDVTGLISESGQLASLFVVSRPSFSQRPLPWLEAPACLQAKTIVNASIAAKARSLLLGMCAGFRANDRNSILEPLLSLAAILKTFPLSKVQILFICPSMSLHIPLHEFGYQGFLFPSPLPYIHHRLPLP